MVFLAGALLCGCRVMHAVTGDELFRTNEPSRVVRGPVVPEAEPQDEQYQAAVDEAELPPLPPAKPAAKKKTDVAMKKP
ncbi:MAG: hypothetical protein IPJ65_26575 [Archangiaceae bacterium]|nr:hypothetical protein [Archangiaceae bacterium]